MDGLEHINRICVFYQHLEFPYLFYISIPYKMVVESLLDESKLNFEDVERLRSYPNIQSIGAAVENMILSTFDLGYGACWLSGLLVAREELEKLLEVKSPNTLVACVAIGKPREKVEQREKKNLSEIFKLIE